MKKVILLTSLIFFVFVPGTRAANSTFQCTFLSSQETWTATTCAAGSTPIGGYKESEACKIFENSSYNPPRNGVASGNYSLPCLTPGSTPASTSSPKDCDKLGGSCQPLSAPCGDYRPTLQCQLSSQSCCVVKSTVSSGSSNTNGATNYAFTNPPAINPGGFSGLTEASCQGKGLADYMNAVIDGVKTNGLTKIKVLSPAFNLTSDTFSGIYQSMVQNGARFSQLDGFAGNVYNVSGRTITSWLTEKLAGTEALGKPLYLTEMGTKDQIDGGFSRTESFNRMATEVDKLKGMSNIAAALLFNAFNSNTGFTWAAWTDPELKGFCQTACTKIGVNWGTGFRRADADYGRIQGYGMHWSLEIARSGGAEDVITAANHNTSIGVSTIVRIGVGSDAGGFTDPKTYVEFLKTLNAGVNAPIYIIAGPNEPDSEKWATPACQNATGRGPLEANFNVLQYACDNSSANPEYHPLRPYPGSPCDPLIPRSIPEAPFDPNKKYNTFACGSSLTPEKQQVFDPYGVNTAYEGLPNIDGFAHTICETRTPEQIAAGGPVTCYRTSKFNVTVDLSHANLGILGNTQDPSLTDAQKVNEYLSWYLTGTPQIGGLEPINPQSQTDINKLVNFSGPLRKLLPQQMLNTLRVTVADSNGKEVHNTTINSTDRLNRVSSSVNGFINGATGILGSIINNSILERLLQNVPFSSMEDTTGEVIMSVFKDPSNNQQEPNLQDSFSKDGRQTAPIKLVIQSATQATK